MLTLFDVSPAQKLLAALFCVASLVSPRGLAKGLDALAEENPENAPAATPAPAAAEGEDKAPESDGEEEAEKKPDEVKAIKEEPVQVSAASRALADKLYLATSFGWVRASKSEGEWRSSGMSDLSLGYKLLQMDKIGLFGTFRYAPMAIAGEIDKIAYRGVWEGYNLGALVQFALRPTVALVGSLELAYVVTHLRSLDSIDSEKNYATKGVMANLGVGMDWQAMPKFALGPRVYGGGGNTKVVQVGVGTSFTF